MEISSSNQANAAIANEVSQQAQASQSRTLASSEPAARESQPSQEASSSTSTSSAPDPSARVGGRVDIYA